MLIGMVVCAIAESAAAGDDFTIGISLYFRRDEFYKDLETGMILEGKDLGVTLIVQDADTDPAKQADQFETFVAQKVDAIAAAITDPSGLIPTVKAAGDSGVPVFAFDGGTAGNEGITTFISMDNYQAGVIVGEWMKQYIEENLGGEANVVILDFPISSVVCAARVDGVKSILEAMSGVQIVAQQDGKASRTESMSVMENILQVNEKVDLVFGINDDTCFGAIAALEAAQRQNVAVISVGWSKEMFEMLENKNPYFRASAIQNPATMGRTTIKTIVDYLNGKEVPPEVLDKAVLVTQDTVDTYEWRSIVDQRQ